MHNHVLKRYGMFVPLLFRFYAVDFSQSRGIIVSCQSNKSGFVKETDRRINED